MRSDPSTRKKVFNFFVAPGKVKKHIFLSEYLADLSSNLKPRENTFEIKNKKSLKKNYSNIETNCVCLFV